MAGINVTSFGGGTLDAYKYKVRMTVGAEAEYAVNDWLGLSLGAFYSQQGANIDWSTAMVIPDEQGVKYIYIPQVKGLAVKIGLQMGVLVNDKINLETHTVAIPIDWGTPEYWRLMENSHWPKEAFSKAEMTDVCKSIDFGIPVGLSYEYKNITLNARYYFGLRRVDKTEDPDKAHNRYLSVTLGYRKAHNRYLSVTLGYRFHL